MISTTLKVFAGLALTTTLSTSALAARGYYALATCEHTETFGEFSTTNHLELVLITEGPDKVPVAVRGDFNFQSSGAGHGSSKIEVPLTSWQTMPLGSGLFGSGTEKINVEGDTQVEQLSGILLDTGRGDVIILHPTGARTYQGCTFKNLPLLQFEGC